MQNRIDAAISTTDRDKILDFISQIRALMPFLIDLSPEDRQTLVKMGESDRPFVEQSLNLVEQDDFFFDIIQSFASSVLIEYAIII